MASVAALDLLDSQVLLDHKVNLEHVEILDSAVRLEPQGCQVKRALLVQQAAQEHPVQEEVLVLREIWEPLVCRDRKVLQEELA